MLEVLAAVVVLGGAAMVLLNAHFTSLNMHDMMSEEVLLRQFTETAVSKAEVEVLQGTLSGGEEFGKRYPDYEWAYEAAIETEDELLKLYRVHVTIAGPDLDRELEFFVFSIVPDDVVTDQ